VNSIIKRMSERLATQSSRRGFFSRMGKAMLGAAALVIGQDYFVEHDAQATSLKCCDHTTQCSTTSCSNGTSNTYTWVCGGHIHCHDCYTTTTPSKYVCTYVTMH
jgi:hypothetical protein